MAVFLASSRKFLAALTGAVAVAVTAGLLNGTIQRWTVGVLAVVTAFVVYLITNEVVAPASTAATTPTPVSTIPTPAAAPAAVPTAAPAPVVAPIVPPAPPVAPPAPVVPNTP